MIIVFNGQDKDLKPENALKIIVDKLQEDKNKKSWKYHLKNLLIINQVVDYKLLVEEISKIDIKSVY